jgi:hypothetical protein
MSCLKGKLFGLTLMVVEFPIRICCLAYFRPVRLFSHPGGLVADVIIASAVPYDIRRSNLYQILGIPAS